MKGFRIKQIEIKLPAYAGDTNFTVKNSQSPKNSKTYEELLGLFVINDRC